jgi:hypothetical protein
MIEFTAIWKPKRKIGFDNNLIQLLSVEKTMNAYSIKQVLNRIAWINHKNLTFDDVEVRF